MSIPTGNDGYGASGKQKGQGAESPLEPMRGLCPMDTLTSALQGLFGSFDLQSHKL